MYTRVRITSAVPLPRAFRRYPDGRFVVAAPSFPTFTSGELTYENEGTFDRRPTAEELGPEQAHAAIALATPPRSAPPRLADADLAIVIEPLRAHLAEYFANVPSGPPGNDVRPVDISNAVAFCMAQGTGIDLACKLVSAVAGEEVSFDDALDTTHDGHIARRVLAARDAAIAAKLANMASAKKAAAVAARVNTRTTKELGVWMFRWPATSRPKRFDGAREILHGGFGYAVFERVGALAAPASAFASFELMPDDFVLEVAQSQIQRAPNTDDAAPVLVLKARANVIDARAVAFEELLHEEGLEKEWRFRVARQVAEVWLDPFSFHFAPPIAMGSTLPRLALAASACVRGLLLAPADVEEEMMTWRPARGTYAWEQADAEGRAAIERTHRERFRSALEAAMRGESALHSPGELLVSATSSQLDTLAIETGRDPLFGRIRSLVTGRATITSEEIDEALASAKPGAPSATWYQRIAAMMTRLGLEKKNVPSEDNASGKAKAWVRT